MNETFWGLYETQIAALKACATPAEENMVLLETAKFLIENLDCSETTMGQYDKFGIRKLFAAHNALGGAVVSFYDNQRSALDPAAQTGAIGKKITAVSEQIKDTSTSLQQLQVLESDLLARENELIALQGDLESWRQKVNQLRAIDEAAESQIQQYQEQFTQLDKIVAEHTQELRFWEAYLEEDSNIVQSMSAYGISSVQGLLDRIGQLQGNISSGLKTLDAMIGTVVKSEEAARDAILKKQNKLV